jgi:hypothetical protein
MFFRSLADYFCSVQNPVKKIKKDINEEAKA